MRGWLFACLDQTRRLIATRKNLDAVKSDGEEPRKKGKESTPMVVIALVNAGSTRHVGNECSKIDSSLPPA